MDEQLTAVFINEKLKEGTYKYCLECKRLVEKDGGCNYVKCCKCGCEMCWVCYKIKGPSGCVFGNAEHNSH